MVVMVMNKAYEFCKKNYRLKTTPKYVKLEMRNFMRICQGKDRFHTTQKPVELIADLVRKHSNEGELVLDCFSGSGSTAMACIKENRRFVGCELDKDYYIKSVARIDAVLSADAVKAVA